MKMIKQLINEETQETIGAYRIRHLKRKQGKDDQWHHAFELEDAGPLDIHRYNLVLALFKKNAGSLNI